MIASRQPDAHVCEVLLQDVDCRDTYTGGHDQS